MGQGEATSPVLARGKRLGWVLLDLGATRSITCTHPRSAGFEPRPLLSRDLWTRGAPATRIAPCTGPRDSFCGVAPLPPSADAHLMTHDVDGGRPGLSPDLSFVFSFLSTGRNSYTCEVFKEKFNLKCATCRGEVALSFWQSGTDTSGSRRTSCAGCSCRPAQELCAVGV